MSKIIKFGRGYSADLYQGLPDKDGNQWEAILLKDNKVAECTAVSKRFKTVGELITYIKDEMLPNCKENNKGKNKVGDVANKQDLFILAKDYLVSHKICYGETVDAVEIMEEAGYKMPKENNALAYIEYLKVAGRLANEVTQQLNSFGFCADMNNQNKKYHPVKKLYKGGNLVYTRFPWTAGFKAEKAIFKGISILKINHLNGVDLIKLAELSPELTTLLQNIINAKLDAAADTQQVFAKNFEKPITEFKKLLNIEEDHLVSVFRKLQPERYGNYELQHQ